MHYDSWKDLMIDLNLEISNLREQIPHWIPCSIRLPESDEKVLCQTVTKKGAVNFVSGYYMSDRWCCGMNSNVVAWMPLPEPYKGGQV